MAAAAIKSQMHLLNGSQKEVLQEIAQRRMQSGGLALPLGFGKTRLGVVLGLEYNKGPVLVVASKTLIGSWLDEIDKAFGDQVPFEVMHRDFLKKNFSSWTPKPETKIVLTTPEVLSDGYSKHDLERKFVRSIQEGFSPIVLQYQPPAFLSPFLRGQVGPGSLFSMTWGCVLVDEIQNHTNILTEKCRAISCLSAHHKWGLSGTMFEEPKNTRYLGFFVILNLQGPRRLPDMDTFLGNPKFPGFKHYLVFRDDNKEFVNRPEYCESIVTHILSPVEKEIFEKFRTVLVNLQKRVKASRTAGDEVGARRFSAYLLSMITYVRQALICPMIPITSIFCDMADFQVKSELSQIVMESFYDLGIDDYFEDEKNIFSSRFKSVLDKINDHKKERCIVFSAFRTTITLFATFVTDRPTMTITAVMSTEKRRQVLKNFSETENAVLLLPYDIGAEGLNLQCASVVMMMDLWWNDSKMQQSIGRIFRPGQQALFVFVYLFISNTGIERKMIDKIDIKKQILSDLHHGVNIGKELAVPRMKISEIIEMIELEDNEKSFKAVRLKRKVSELAEEVGVDLSFSPKDFASVFGDTMPSENTLLWLKEEGWGEEKE